MGNIPFSAEADRPSTCVWGYVTTEDTGEPMPYIEILFTLERTSETIAAETDQGGYYYISLKNFIQGWRTGDYVFLRPELLSDYFICHAVIYLSPNVNNYAYQMDLGGTPIPNADYVVDDAGSMFVVNHDWNLTRIKNMHEDNEVIGCQGYEGVQIFVTCCYEDDGSTAPLYGAIVEIVWQISSKYHNAQQWIKHAYRYWEYAISPGEYESGNPPNIMIEWSAEELSQGLRTIDIRMHVFCGWESGSWEKETIVENIRYRFI